MNFEIREMKAHDKCEVMDMMRVFYASDAVSTNGSEEIFSADIDNCIGDCPFVEGYVFSSGDKIIGYSMIAKSYSTEFGKRCVWIEDIYVKEAYRGLGIGTRFFDFIEEKYEGCIFRLEAEEENERAVHVYKKCGYKTLPYLELVKI